LNFTVHIYYLLNPTISWLCCISIFFVLHHMSNDYSRITRSANPTSHAYMDQTYYIGWL